MDQGQIWSFLEGPELCVGPIQVDSFPYNTFLRRPAKEELLEKTGMSLASLGGFAGILCCLMHSWRRGGRRESILSFYISGDGRLGWNSGLRTSLVIQSWHQFPHLCCKLDYLCLFSLQSLLEMWPQLSAKPSLLKQRTHNRLGAVFRHPTLPWSAPFETHPNWQCSQFKRFFTSLTLSNRGFNPRHQRRGFHWEFSGFVKTHKFTWKKGVRKMHITKPETGAVSDAFWCSFLASFCSFRCFFVW